MRELNNTSQPAGAAPVQYDRFGRMKFHPDYHGKHGTYWTNTEEQYLIENYNAMGPEAVSLALERTIGTVMTKANELRKAGRLIKPAKIVLHKRARNL